ncbi:alpha-2-macroglobulin-like [Periophthalmus magnuspinnatus]|uniref:alpha-2-macroglobulin-like n=1 Tax=Periophthalmus magnuspinnatus TaxID=409849 RepID=UPI002436BDFF|nr:alpha-2-macroglobulin-like [Periophthalmus magnuspinnatus]
MVQLTFDLDPQAKEGSYSVSVKVKGARHEITHKFDVEKYVLPKFSVEVEAPAEVSIAPDEFPFKVCGKYTFGQPVPGSVQLTLGKSDGAGDTRIDYIHKNSSIQNQQVSKDGCASFSFQTSELKKLTPTSIMTGHHEVYSHYTIHAMMTEEGTGLKQENKQWVKISYELGKVEFVNPPTRYNSGDVLELQVKAVHYNNTPVSNTDIHLLKNNDLLHTLNTDQDGVATFKFNTSQYTGRIRLKASLYNESVSTRMNPHFTTASLSLLEIKAPSLHTKTTSTLEVVGEDRTLTCGAKESFTVGYNIVGEGQGKATLIYLVLSRGVIVKYGHYTTYMDTIMQGELTFNMEITSDMAPAVTLVTYAVLPSESVIAASKEFNTEKCFGHKVQLEFAPPSSVPGEQSSLKVSAAPLTLCGISAVDKSVLIHKPGKSLDADKLFSLLPVQRAEQFPYHIEDDLGCVKVRTRKSLYLPERPDKDDVYHILKGRGLKMATNLFIRTPTCVNLRGNEYFKNRYGYSSPRHGFRGPLRGMPTPQMFHLAYEDTPARPPPPVIQTVRTFFPETWIWDLVEVGALGHVTLPLTVPDTITTWQTEAFCLSPQEGIGLAPPQQHTVFQPFFLEQVLPYSIIRGESFELKATVFNYLSSCIMMDVRVAPSADFTLTPLSSDQYTSCLCGNEQKTLSWTLLASSLGDLNITVTAEAIPSAVQCDNEVMSVPERGRKDVVTRVLRVQAEGSEVSKAFNWLLCPKGKSLKEQVELTLPENVIPGSARASVSVLGDILGRAMKNLDGLLKMPYGCGEQNMALLAPNIYILQYLNTTQQLSPEVNERALKFLSSGYQRQLNYKDRHGAYSTFGRGEGNTWLTAFVVRCFAKAQAFVYIDPKKVHQSQEWLETRQMDDGCFEPSGKLFNNRMKGGVSDTVTLSAYITAAFLEMNRSRNDSVIQNSLSCLKNHSKNMENIYTTALMAYVFSLARDTETHAQLLNKLRSQATEEDTRVHWSSSSSSSSSLSVEIASYVLLSILSQSSVSLEDQGYTSKIVRWLTGEQNSYGGFRSTQDTVVALQALSMYSAMIFNPDGSSSVLVQDLNRPTEGSLSFTVEPSNKLLYQERALGGAAGQYSVEVTGSACASVQISLHYNIPTPSEVRTLGVKVESQMDCGGSALQLHLEAQYFGDLNSTNMVILDVKVLSGFVPDEKSVKNLESLNDIDRVEQNGDHILIYISGLSTDQPVTCSLRLIRETVVHNLKPAVVKIYDYYQPSDEAETEYTSPCAAPTKD